MSRAFTTSEDVRAALREEFATPSFQKALDKILTSVVRQYNLDHYWKDDLRNMAWEIMLNAPPSQLAVEHGRVWLYTRLRREAARIRFGYIPESGKGRKPLKFIEFKHEHATTLDGNDAYEDAFDLMVAQERLNRYAQICSNNLTYLKILGNCVREIDDEVAAMEIGYTICTYRQYRTDMRRFLKQNERILIDLY